MVTRHSDPSFWVHKYGFTFTAACRAAFAAASSEQLRYEVVTCLATGGALKEVWDKEVGEARAVKRLRVLALAERLRPLRVEYTAN